MLTKRHIEFARLIETAKSVEARAIQIIKKLRRFRALPLAAFDELVEPAAVAVESRLVILHPNCYLQASLQMSVEVNEVRVDVVQYRLLRLQTEWCGEPTAERLNITPARMRSPKRCEVGHQPTLSPSPFQGWLRQRILFN